MKKWKKIKIITILVIVAFYIRVGILAYSDITMTYPTNILGMMTYDWTDIFAIDFVFILIIWLIPLIIDITLLIIASKKLKKKN